MRIYGIFRLPRSPKRRILNGKWKGFAREEESTVKKKLALLLCLVMMLLATAAQASVKATLTARMATRSGPSTKYTELGSYFSRGTKVTAVSRSYDSRNGIWWIQVEFKYRNSYRRAYTGRKRMVVVSNQLPEEKLIGKATFIDRTTPRYGPGEKFEEYKHSYASGTHGEVYFVEDGWVQMTYKSAHGQLKRFWVPQEAVTLELEEDTEEETID